MCVYIYIYIIILVSVYPHPQSDHLPCPFPTNVPFHLAGQREEDQYELIMARCPELVAWSRHRFICPLDFVGGSTVPLQLSKNIEINRTHTHNIYIYYYYVYMYVYIIYYIFYMCIYTHIHKHTLEGNDRCRISSFSHDAHRWWDAVFEGPQGCRWMADSGSMDGHGFRLKMPIFFNAPKWYMNIDIPYTNGI